MQENNFEKQVRERLDELRFQPTAPVWQQVSTHIRKRRKRRRLAYFTLAALILTTAAIGWPSLRQWTGNKEPVAQNESAMDVVKSNTSSSAKQAESNTSDTPANLTDRLPNADNNGSSQQASGSAITEPGTKAANTPANESQATSYKATSDITKSSVSPKENAGRGKSIRNRQSAIGRESTKANWQMTDRTKPSDESGKDKYRELPQTTISSATESISQFKVDQVSELHQQDPIALEDKLHEINGKGVHIAESKPSNPARKKISWGLEFSAGVSKRRDQALPGIFKNQEVMDLYQGSPLTMGPAASQAIVRSFPSQSQPGVAFSLGATAKLPLTKRLNLRAGLRYSYQSEQVKVGMRKDTTVVITNFASQSVTTRTVYEGRFNRSYTNRYHFVELPIGIDMQLNRGRKTPIYFELGAAPSYMIGSNALVYDTAFSGIYYKDRSVLQRFQVSAISALSIELGSRKGPRWSIGPELRMQLTPLTNSVYDNRQYLMYGGVRARLLW